MTPIGNSTLRNSDNGCNSSSGRDSVTNRHSAPVTTGSPGRSLVGNASSTAAQPTTTANLEQLTPCNPPQRSIQPYIYGTPLKAPAWPQNRSLENIGTLHTFHRVEDFENLNHFTLPMLLTNLPDNATVFDFGAGTGRFLCELKTAAHHKQQNITTIAVSGTELSDESLQPTNSGIDEVYYTFVPDDTVLLDTFRGKADLILDSFGPATYTPNPLHLLIYAALLLKPDGHYSSLSSTGTTGLQAVGDLERERPSMFGDSNTRDKIAAFFEHHLGINDMTFRPSVIRSEVRVGELKVDMLTQFSGSKITVEEPTLKNTQAFYQHLIQLADREIGEVAEDEDLGWFRKEGFSIVTKHYTVSQAAASTSSAL